MSKYCQKCGRTLKETEFYSSRSGELAALCKKCMTMHVDNFNPETFTWLIQELDFPYVPAEWNILRDRAYAKDPAKMNGMSVLGKYLSKMRLNQFKGHGWEDSELLQQQSAARDEQEEAEREEYKKKIQEQFDSGELTEVQYKTLMPVEVQHEHEPPPPPPEPEPPPEDPYMSEDELVDFSADLTDEDRKYLAMKWGRMYKPNEWVALERKYNEMMESFPITDSDTLGTLILICKTYLKMNNAIKEENRSRLNFVNFTRGVRNYIAC